MSSTPSWAPAAPRAPWDAANIIKPALGRARSQVIGATTLNEYRKYIEKDAALERRFQPVQVGEPSQEATLEILKGLREKYEKHHKLQITDEALEAAVKLSARYINDRFLPDKAIDLMDEAASRVRLETEELSPELKSLEEKIAALAKDKEAAIAAQDYEKAASCGTSRRTTGSRWSWSGTGAGRTTRSTAPVTADDIAAVVSGWTGIPVTRLTEDEGERLLHMEDTLHKRVVGQDEAVKAVARAIRRGRVGSEGPQAPHRLLPVPGPHRRGQDGAVQVPGRGHVRRRERHDPHRHVRVHGAAHGLPSDRLSAGLCGPR